MKAIIKRSKKINNKRVKQSKNNAGKSPRRRDKSKGRSKSRRRNGSLSRSADFKNRSLSRGLYTSPRKSKTRKTGGSKSRGRSNKGRSRSGNNRSQKAKDHLKSMKNLGKEERKRNRTKSRNNRGGASRSRSNNGKLRRAELIEQTIPGIFSKRELAIDQRKPSKLPGKHHCDASFPEVIALNPQVIMPLRMKSSNRIPKYGKNYGKESARQRRRRLYDDTGVRSDLKKYESEKGKKKLKGLIYKDLKSPLKTGKSKKGKVHTHSGRKSHAENQKYDVGNFYMYESFKNLNDGTAKKKTPKTGLSKTFAKIKIGDKR